ncbi:MAG: hypothetical protein ACKVZJ_09070 [Phycisphaerales bacterium]
MSPTSSSPVPAIAPAIAPRPRRRPLGAAVLFLGSFLLAAIIILSGRVGTGESADQINYHVPVIQTFASQLPSPDLSKYDSATTPGYHLVMAVVWKLTGAHQRWPDTVPAAPVSAGPTPEFPRRTLDPDERAAWSAFIRDLAPLQLLNALLTSGLIVTVYWLASRFVVWWLALALTLPLALNQYVLGAAIWLTTDNVGWFFALAALACAMTLTCARGVTHAAAWTTAAVLVRQVHLWVCAPIALAGVLAWLVGHRERRTTLAMTVVGCAVPTAVVAAFAFMWGGLTPPSPRIREVHGGGISFAALPFALSLFGAYALVLFPAWRDQLRTLARHRTVYVGLALLALASALIVATSTQQPTLTDPPMRGYGWLWRASALFPPVADRSPALALGAPMGILLLAMLVRAARERGHGKQALILLAGLAAWLLAQMVNPAAWQRYFDPIILVGVAWFAALAAPPERKRALAIAAVALALFMAALSARSIGRDLRSNELPFDGGVLKMQGKL